METKVGLRDWYAQSNNLHLQHFINVLKWSLFVKKNWGVATKRLHIKGWVYLVAFIVELNVSSKQTRFESFANQGLIL